MLITVPNSSKVAPTAFWCEDYPSADQLMDKLQSIPHFRRFHRLSEIEGCPHRVVIFYLRSDIALAQGLQREAHPAKVQDMWSQHYHEISDLCRAYPDRVQLVELTEALTCTADLEQFLQVEPLGLKLEQEMAVQEDPGLLAIAQVMLYRDADNQSLLRALHSQQVSLDTSGIVKGRYTPEALFFAYSGARRWKGTADLDNDVPQAQFLLMQEREHALNAYVEHLVQHTQEMARNHAEAAQLDQRMQEEDVRLQDADRLLQRYQEDITELQGRYQGLTQELSAVQENLNRIIQSKSYRMLAPLRALRALFA